MDSLFTISLVLKGSTIAILALLAFQFARMRDLRGLAGALLVVSVCCYVVLHFFRSADRPALLLPLHLGAITVSFWLYTFSRSLFSDDFRLLWPHWLVLLVLLGIGTTAFFVVPIKSDDRSLFEALFVLIPRFISLGLVIAAIVGIYRESEGDLIFARRTFRRRFILSVGIATFSILVLEIYMRGQCPPLLLDFVSSLGILLVSFVVALSSFTLEPFLLEGRATGGKETPEMSGDLSQEEIEIKTKLTKFMEQAGYTEESLTIRSLAAKISVQEYKLRRLINLRLGFRNFSDYLNGYRVDAACQILRDPARSDLPVLRLAMDLGYGSLAPFNRAFRARTGRNPTQYRAEAINQ